MSNHPRQALAIAAVATIIVCGGGGMIAYADNVTLADVRAANTTIFETNAPPVIAEIPYQITDQLVRLTFTVNATDPDTPANMLVYSLEGNIPEGASINSTTGVFSWTPSRNQSGHYPITVAVNYGADYLIYQTVDVIVLPPNFPVIDDDSDWFHGPDVTGAGDGVTGESYRLPNHRCWTHPAKIQYMIDNPFIARFADDLNKIFSSEPADKYKNISPSNCQPFCPNSPPATEVTPPGSVFFNIASLATARYGSQAGMTYSMAPYDGYTDPKLKGATLGMNSGFFYWVTGSDDVGGYAIKFTANDSGYICTIGAVITVKPAYTSPSITVTSEDTAYTDRIYTYTVVGDRIGLKYTVSITDPDDEDFTILADHPLKITTSGKNGLLTWNIPHTTVYDYTGTYKVTVTATDNVSDEEAGGKPKSDTESFTLKVRENNTPVLTVTHGKDTQALVGEGDEHEIVKYISQSIQYNFHGKDTDLDHTLTLSVSNPTGFHSGALTNCETGDAREVYNNRESSEPLMNTVTLKDTKTNEITGFACVFALAVYEDSNPFTGDTGADHFTIQLSDGVDADSQQIFFRVVDYVETFVDLVKLGAPVLTEEIKKTPGVGVLIEGSVKNLIQFLSEVATKLTVDEIILLRCEELYYPEDTNWDNICDRYDIEPKNGDASGTSEEIVAGSQSEERKPKWTIIANVSNTANISFYDTNIEPGKVYTYAARAFVGNKSTEYIPLGSVTTPVDKPPVITLKGPTTMYTTLGTPYVEPGYSAIDFYDGNVTDDMTVSNSVDVNREGNYNIFYYASDSAGNLATPQKRIVFVIDDSTPPVLTLKGSKTISMDAGLTYTDPGYSAIDNKDGNITDNVVVTGTVNTRVPDVYTIQYDVSDRVGNKAPTQTRTVTIIGDDTPPVITLKGNKTITIEAGLTYVDPGYTATDNRDGNITDMVVITGTVDTNTPGTYTIQYDVLDSSSNAAIQQIRTITVVDTVPPTLTLKGGSSITIPASVPYVDPGYTATDNTDGNVRVEIVGWVNTNQPGSYSIQYTAYDSSDNKAPPQIRMIIVEDVTPPVITLKGNSSITVPASIPYTDPGYTAIDNIDGDITGRVVISGMVDTDTLGDYTIYYDVSDWARNAAIQQNRTVTVVDLTPPVITLKGGDSITVPASVPYVEPGYTAIDNIDGNLTENVVITGHVDTDVPGTYTLHYDVWDAELNLSPVQNRTVIVADMTPPVITLTGNATVTIPMGPTYTDPGYTATDNIDGDITSMVTVSGTVNPLIPGIYTISYTVTDAAGNNKQQERVVTVSPPTDTTLYCNDMTLAQLMASGKYNIINKMFSSDSNIKGTNKADLIIVGNNGPTIEGKDGDDCIIGGSGNDTILGQVGNDIMYGNGGNDEIRGGDNKDIIHGGSGNDELHGGSGHDTIHGEGGADEIHGGAGNDTIYGGSEDDKILGLNGNDTIYGEGGNDTIYAGPGNDTIYGGPGTDTIEAGETDTVHDDSNGE